MSVSRIMKRGRAARFHVVAMGSTSAASLSTARGERGLEEIPIDLVLMKDLVQDALVLGALEDGEPVVGVRATEDRVDVLDGGGSQERRIDLERDDDRDQDISERIELQQIELEHVSTVERDRLRVRGGQ